MYIYKCIFCRYTWIGACNATGERVFEITDPYLDSKGRSVMWILSTPHYCLDYLECHVLDTVTKDGSLASLLVNDVYGELVWYNNIIILLGRTIQNICVCVYFIARQQTKKKKKDKDNKVIPFT